MNGVHDMGGMHGFGPVEIEQNEPIFHARWEERTFALTLAAAELGRWNLDMSRYAREQMPPTEYLRSTYYERWLWGLRKLLVERGLASEGELRTGRAESKAGVARPLRVEDLPRLLQNRRGARMDDAVAPKFKAGDLVRARNLNPIGHTRLPRYARGRQGVIERDHGVFVFADANAMGMGKKPQHVYSVRFPARELWGPDASAHDSVFVDLWDDHLDPA
jgi:nitrile hydratase